MQVSDLRTPKRSPTMTSEASPPSVTAQSVYAELHADEGDAGGALTRVPLAEFCANEGAQSPVHLVAVNLSNAIIGAGIVGLPYALRLSGVWCGLLLLAAMAGVTNYSLGLLVGAGVALRERDYESLALRALGPWGERVVLASQLAFDYGAALSYLIITGDTATSVMKAATGGGFVGLRQLCILALALAFKLPLCLLRDISKLETFSSISIVTVVVVAALVTAKLALRDTPSLQGAPFVTTRPLDVVTSVGIFSF